MTGSLFRLSLFFFATFGVLSLQTTPIRGEDEFDEETGCKLVSTVSDFDIDEYASKPWYIHQQAVTSYSPIDQNYCVKAEYTVREKATFWGYTVDVMNEAKNEVGGTFGGSLCAYQTGTEGDDLSKLAVSPCFLPKVFAGPYWIVAYNETEGYALISGGQPFIRADPDDISAGCKTGSGTNNSGLWIFSRNQTRDDALVEKVRMIASDSGFDLSVLGDVNQTACDICQDTEDEFTIWWAGTVDCEFVDKWSWAGTCWYAKDECPETCGECDDEE